MSGVAAGPFRFRPGLTAAFVAAFLVLLGLGSWQVARLQWKTGLIARTEALASREPVRLDADLTQANEYAHVWLTGGFPTDAVLHVTGTHAGAPGYFVFQPFRPDEGGHGLVLVNRGFVRADERRDGYPLPSADRLTGLVRDYGSRGPFAAPPDADGRTAYDRSYETLTAPFASVADEAGFARFYIDSTLPTALPRGGTTRLDFSNRHLGYAITWYGLAGGLLAVFLVMSRERRRP